MNPRKLMPANGINNAAVAMPLLWWFSQSAEFCTPSGILTRIRISVAPKSNANTTPARAAARGVFS